MATKDPWANIPGLSNTRSTTAKKKIPSRTSSDKPLLQEVIKARTDAQAQAALAAIKKASLAPTKQSVAESVKQAKTPAQAKAAIAEARKLYEKKQASSGGSVSRAAMKRKVPRGW